MMLIDITFVRNLAGVFLTNRSRERGKWGRMLGKEAKDLNIKCETIRCIF